MHIVDALGLPNYASTMVRVSQDVARSETQTKDSDGPIWNEAIIFDIRDESKPLTVSVLDNNKEVIRNAIKLQDVKEYRDMGTDIWLQHEDGAKESDPRVRIRLTYNYSDVQKYTSLLGEWNDYIGDDINEYEWICHYLTQLTEPFSFFLAFHKVEGPRTTEEAQDLEEQRQQTRFKDYEEAVSRQFERQFVGALQAGGYQRVPWFNVTMGMLFVQLVLSGLASYERPDFVTSTACALTIYLLENTENLRRRAFRQMLGLIAVSLLYDLIWFALVDYSGDNSDGGQESLVRRFSLCVSYISFFFRVRPPLLTCADTADAGAREGVSRLCEPDQTQEVRGGGPGPVSAAYKCWALKWQD